MHFLNYLSIGAVAHIKFIFIYNFKRIKSLETYDNDIDKNLNLIVKIHHIYL